MRTTLNINDKLLRSAKLKALETNQTLTAVVEDALRQTLEGKTATSVKRSIVLPASGAGGLLPRVDLDDTSALVDLMEGGK